MFFLASSTIPGSFPKSIPKQSGWLWVGGVGSGEFSGPHCSEVTSQDSSIHSQGSPECRWETCDCCSADLHFISQKMSPKL